MNTSKMKVTAIIVSRDMKLKGFVIAGADSAFGGIGSNIVQRAISVKELMQVGFKNSQIYFENNFVYEKGTFKLAELPMRVIEANGTLIEADNRLELVERYLYKNQNIGYKVRIGAPWNTEVRKKTEDIARLSSWFRPVNFMVRTREDGKQYLAGKGIQINNLPVVVLDEKKKTVPKKTKPSTVQKATPIQNPVGSFDLMDVFDFVKSKNGMIINMPDVKYIRTTRAYSEASSEFIPLKIGEVADPYIDYNDVKMNANARFKKIGVLFVPIGDGRPAPIDSFVYATKSIFSNGEAHVSSIAVGIPEQFEGELLAVFAKGMVSEKITDESWLRTIRSVTGANTYTFYKMDVTGLELMGKDKIAKSIISDTDIVALLKKRYIYGMITKVLDPGRGLLKDIKKEVGDDSYNKMAGIEIAPMFRGYSENDLAIIAESGIDIYSGAFKKFIKSESTAGSAEGKPGVDKNTEVQIEYTLNRYDLSKATAKNIIDVIKANPSEDEMSKLKFVVTPSIIKALYPVVTGTGITTEERLKMAYTAYRKASIDLLEVKRQLWMLNTAMFTVGDKKEIFTHDRANWAVDSTSKVKVGTQYVCVAPGVIGLKVKTIGCGINAEGTDPNIGKTKATKVK